MYFNVDAVSFLFMMKNETFEFLSNLKQFLDTFSIEKIIEIFFLNM
jgi:hypothetical protein